MPIRPFLGVCYRPEGSVIGGRGLGECIDGGTIANLAPMIHVKDAGSIRSQDYCANSEKKLRFGPQFGRCCSVWV